MTAFVLKRVQANGRRGPEPLKYVRLSRVFALQMKQLWTKRKQRYESETKPSQKQANNCNHRVAHNSH